ncbi:DUF1295 domain-containing protein [Spiroplasma endosymbiont of Nebria brevicollis]|uniref:DUF1295 domain-containing protein n=1 Tax=Spiroplasma endosymbiont of Nebria brevicollis TaxID=3066284 RepID=UPI00313DB6DC
MDFYIILWVLLISLGINLTFFILAFIFKTDILTDITYCLSFIILSVVIVTWKQNFSPVQICLFILYNLWALRLGSYLLMRIITTKIDHRFDKMRNRFWKFGMFWVLQGLSVFLISIPTIFALSIDANYFNSNFSYYSIIFIALAVLFLLIETIADWQKFRFYKKKRKIDFFINYGLWKDCRHPNYLGEIGFWYMMTGLLLCDLFIKNLNNKNLDYLIHLLWLLSPMYINILLIKVSGVPLLEINQWQKLHDNMKYQEYLKTTSCVLFYIGKKGPINKVSKLIVV